MFFDTVNRNHQLQCNANSDMSLDKTLLTLTALRDDLKILCRPGAILDSKRSGRPSINEETIDAVLIAFHHSPRKSIRVASNELAIPQSTVHKVLDKHFDSMLTNYKLFKLFRIISLAEQFLMKKFFSAWMITMTILNVWFSQTKHLFTYLGNSISITLQYKNHKILMRL